METTKPIEAFHSGPVEVTITPDEAIMGQMTASHIVRMLKSKTSAGIPVALWLMAAPSAFAFYRELCTAAQHDMALQKILRQTHFFQFDDYPVSRQDRHFEITFRRLLERHLYEPLSAICGKLEHIHPLELTGTDADKDIARQYQEELLALKRTGTYFLQLKGVGMDGHWGFHGAETPLDMEPAMIAVPITPPNIRQQMLDWPQFFSTPQEVPKTAYTFNVPMFLLADEIVDNVPQSSKVYAVLATYGTDAVINAIPSSAIKKHPRARAYLTRAAAEVLLEFRLLRQADPQARLSASALAKLRRIWQGEDAPELTAKNIAAMENVLRQLGMI